MDLDRAGVRLGQTSERLFVSTAYLGDEGNFRRSGCERTTQDSLSVSMTPRDELRALVPSLHRTNHDEEVLMSKLRTTIAIDASPDDVWTVLGDLPATPEWLPGTASARMEGSVRLCTTVDGSEIREEISDYSADERSYRYRHIQVPLPVSYSSGRFTVEPGSNGGAVVVLESEFEALDPAMAAELETMFGGALDQALESLRRRVEHGIRWDAA